MSESVKNSASVKPAYVALPESPTFAECLAFCARQGWNPTLDTRDGTFMIYAGTSAKTDGPHLSVEAALVATVVRLRASLRELAGAFDRSAAADAELARLKRYEAALVKIADRDEAKVSDRNLSERLESLRWVARQALASGAP